MASKTALNLGFGGKKISIKNYDVINIDIRKEVNPDLVADVKKLPFPQDSIDLIHASHLLEHIGRHEIYHLLKHWRDILKKDGILHLIVPDLTVAAIELLSGTTWPATWDILYGAQSNPFDFHYSGFTAPSLEALLKKYGFEIKSLENKNREIHCEAVKSNEKFHG